MVTRAHLLPFLAGAGVVALFATSMVAVSQAQQADRERERAERLEARVAELELDVAELEAQVEALEAGGGLESLLGGLLGGDLGDLGGAGGLAELFGGLLGGGGELDGSLDGLFGAGGIPGADCLTPDLDGGGLGGLLDGGFDGLFGGSATTSADPEDVVAAVTTQVEQLRELRFDREVEVAFLDDEALGAELAGLLDEQLDADELAARTAVLTALRAVPSTTDLDTLRRELLDDQVAGYYVPDEERLVVRSPDDGRLTALDRVVLAHELQHAVADQVLGLPELEDVDTDAALARLAVVEGDATLLMHLWTLEHLSFGDQLSLLGAGDLAGQQEVLARVPHHLRRELLFPYTAGLDLICDRWLEGGWAAVDAAYDRLPTTSAGVLWSERYDDPPSDPPVLSAPDGATAATTDTFGAAELAWLLEAPGGEAEAALDDPLGRAAAWAGGEVHVWETDAGPVVGLALRDRRAGDPPLCGTVMTWAVAALGGPPTRSDEVTVVTDDDGAIAVSCDADAVGVGAARSVAQARAVATLP